MESFLLFAGSLFASTWFVVSMFFIAVISDYNQSKRDNFGWSAFYTIIALIATCLMFKPSVGLVIGILVCWIPLGLCWAVAKWKLRISHTKYLISEMNLTSGDAEYRKLQRRLDIDNVKSTVAYWVLFFPISMMSTCLFNVFESIEYLVTVKLGGTFKRMAAEAFK